MRVIVLSTRTDDECLMQAMSCGAAGYLTLTPSAAELETAIKAVAKGKTYVSIAATKPLLDFARYRAVNETFALLTPRQRDVLRLIAEGNTTKQIALALNISVKTVETHRMLLTERLDIHSTAGLVRYAIKAGLMRLED